jgi:hypothetical protein
MTLANVIAFLGFAGIIYIVGTLVVIGRKLQILDDLTATTDKIKKNLKVVTDFLIGSNMKFSSSELEGYSPLSLTEEGKRFIEKIGFDKIFNEHKADFFGCIEGEKPKLKYDVEIAAIKSISLFHDKEYMNFLKILFYNEPNRNTENTAPTLGVYVRDAYLAAHPEITQ